RRTDRSRQPHHREGPYGDRPVVRTATAAHARECRRLRVARDQRRVEEYKVRSSDRQSVRSIALASFREYSSRPRGNSYAKTPMFVDVAGSCYTTFCSRSICRYMDAEPGESQIYNGHPGEEYNACD